MNRPTQIETALRHLAPRIPQHEFGAVIDHALTSAGLRTASPESAAWLSLVAYVRHVHTDYDELLTAGFDAECQIASNFASDFARRGNWCECVVDAAEIKLRTCRNESGVNS